MNDDHREKLRTIVTGFSDAVGELENILREAEENNERPMAEGLNDPIGDLDDRLSDLKKLSKHIRDDEEANSPLERGKLKANAANSAAGKAAMRFHRASFERLDEFDKQEIKLRVIEDMVEGRKLVRKALAEANLALKELGVSAWEK